MKRARVWAEAGAAGAIAMLTAALACSQGAAGQEVGASEWQPVAQPDLAREFEQAKPLGFEEVCDGPVSCWEGPVWWFPNPDGKTHDMLVFYWPHYGGPYQGIQFDFGTGKMKELTGPGAFHLAQTFRAGSKYFVGLRNIVTYDPATNVIEDKGHPLKDHPLKDKVSLGADDWSPCMAVSDDGTQLYRFGHIGNKVVFFRIDAGTFAATLYDPVAEQNPLNFTYSSLEPDGDWAYAFVRGGPSQAPCRLYGFNYKTGKGLIVAETEPVIGGVHTVQVKQLPDYPGCELEISDMKGQPGKKLRFWLRDGKLTARTGDTPPWAAEKFAKPRVHARVSKIVEKPPAGVEFKRGGIAKDGTVRLWYRLKGEALAAAQSWADAKVKAGGWGSIDITAKLYPTECEKLVATPDGRLLVLGGGYAMTFSYNPATRLRELLGPSDLGDLSIKTVGDRIYLCGYPSSLTWIYDPAKPWTRGGDRMDPPKDGPEEKPAPGGADQNENPLDVGRFMELNHVHIPIAGVAPAARNRVFFGGICHRNATGGGLGWYDTATGKKGGLHDPFSAYEVFWIASAAEGRYVLVSTKPVSDEKNHIRPERGVLFVYDVEKDAILHKVEDSFWTIPGYICEALPGLVMGYTYEAKDPGKGILYGFDPAAGKILWKKPVPAGPVTSFSAIRRHRYFFEKGPDGAIWATMNGTLCRIDPQTAKVTVVGKMKDLMLAFAQGRVYVAGDLKLRCIAGIAVPAQKSPSDGSAAARPKVLAP